MMRDIHNVGELVTVWITVYGVLRLGSMIEQEIRRDKPKGIFVYLGRLGLRI